jgi:hypothetical protein
VKVIGHSFITFYTGIYIVKYLENRKQYLFAQRRVARALYPRRLRGYKALGWQ